MRLVSDAIPSTFTRLDETAIAADRFIDVRTQQQLRTNHNALLAAGHMRPVFADNFPTLGIPSKPDGWAGIADQRMMPAIYSTDVYLSPLVRKCKVRFKCSLANSLDVGIYAALTSRVLDNRTLASTVTSTAAATWYTMDVTVPQSAVHERARQRVRFNLWVTLQEVGADILGGAVNLFDATNVSVSALNSSVSTVGTGDILYFPSNTDIEPRIIQGWSTYSSGGSTYRRFYISDKMEWVRNEPEATTPDTMQAKHGNVITIKGVQLYEYARTGNWSDLEVDI